MATPTSSSELSLEQASDPNGVHVPVYMPNGIENVKMNEVGTTSPPTINASPPYYFPSHGNPSSMPGSTPMHRGHIIVHAPPSRADNSMSMIGVLPVHSPSGRRASSPKAKLTKSKLTKTKLTKTKLNKTPRERNNRGRRGTTTKTDTPLSAPLSELTAHMADVPLRDMDAWVHRSTEVRLQENAERETIARPMNSFMLYRSAYAERIKRLLSQNAHHFVSSTAGKSWWIEPAHITDKYKELAQIECEAHSRAHPTYKLKFKKGPPTTTRPDEYTPSPLTNTLEDEHSMAPPIPWTQSYEYPPSSRGSNCFGSSDSFMTHGGYLGSSWNTSHPSVSMVYPQPLITRHIEVLQFHHGSPMSQDIQYGASNSLVGLPGGTHHELLQPQVVHPPAGHLPNGPINLEFLDLSF